jgi:pyruvate formate lyase activating enzyme
MNGKGAKGVVFNIQHYSIHDGPGIRTTVFLKGCPLTCLWCQNPESQVIRPILFLNEEKCTGCGLCRDACPEAAIQLIDGKSKTDRSLCKGKGHCTEICPNEARSLMGQYMTADEVFNDVNADAIFYQNSGGGVTLSGGDPIVQTEFAIQILKRCRDAGIHTAIETCGFTVWDSLKELLVLTDLVLYDKAYTGVSNKPILENAKRIVQDLNLPMLARLPIIPGYNDSSQNLEQAACFIASELGTHIKVHLLPYHRLGVTKYERMEQANKALHIDSPSDEQMQELKELFESFGLITVIGG